MRVLISILMACAAVGLVPVAVGREHDALVIQVLERRCLNCHNASDRKGGLSLATRNAALAGGESGTSITLKTPENSLLLEYVSGPKPAMPKDGPALTVEEVAAVRAWIAGGAAWPGDRPLVDRSLADTNWWSLLPLVRRPLPTSTRGSGKSQTDHPIDIFLQTKLTEHQLTPVADADPVTFIRRVTFDLTGLPPTPGEVTEFVQLIAAAANPDDAVDALVDRLLASPAFGEKLARHWLDVARYGESHGYDKDKPRLNAWPYRDYVIRSLNEDKPYARFVQEQIAGDALFPGEPEGVLGLGFLAAGPWDFIGHTEVGEGKVDGRIAKHLDRDEMISAVFNVFLSTTVQCAQCHHHKFDPIKMEDYYRLHAVFAAVDRADRVYAGLPPDQERMRNSLVARKNALQAERSQIDTELKRAIEARASGLDRRLTELKQKHGSVPLPQFGWHSQVSGVQDAVKWVQVDLGEPQAVKQLRLIPAFDKFSDIGAGFGFPLRYKVEAANDAGFQTGSRLLRDATDVDQPNPKDREVFVEVGGAPIRFIRVTATKLAPRKNDFIFALGELEAIGVAAQQNIARSAAVTALDSIEAPPRWSLVNLTDGIFHRAVDDPQAFAELRQLEDQRSAIEAELRTPETTARLAAIDRELPKLAKQLAAFPKGELVYAAATDFTAQGRFLATAGQPRPIALLNRGDIRSPDALMHPGMPPLWTDAPAEFSLPANSTEAEARVALARAITSRDNPLLWRSIVNRLWQWTFGQPLVGTPNDFGQMGLQPTHPELLDWLAVQLRDDPQQSLKSVIRLLVTSRAYRRASTHDAANASLDANNKFLWRANRRRLTAEEYRDAVLAVSGKLRLDERGGPSFQDFVIEKPEHSPHYQYHLHDPDNPASHRRSIYRFVVRSQPQPFLTTLDCADPSLSVPARDESTTALQALAQWNNRLVEVMSRNLAHRLEHEATSPNARLDLACQLALARSPTATERAVLGEYLQTHGTASLARVIFNLNAFIYVD